LRRCHGRSLGGPGGPRADRARRQALLVPTPPRKATKGSQPYDGHDDSDDETPEDAMTIPAITSAPPGVMPPAPRPALPSTNAASSPEMKPPSDDPPAVSPGGRHLNSVVLLRLPPPACYCAALGKYGAVTTSFGRPRASRRSPPAGKRDRVGNSGTCSPPLCSMQSSPSRSRIGERRSKARWWTACVVRAARANGAGGSGPAGGARTRVTNTLIVCVSRRIARLWPMMGSTST
jgi:hypothetical protein